MNEISLAMMMNYMINIWDILTSDLSILKIWISLLGEDIIIKTRPNNIFYSDCFIHRAHDIPVCINEKEKGFFCYGCGYGGTIVKLISEYFNIGMESALNLLYSYINNDLDLLNKEQLEIAKTIFKNYNSPLSDKYFDESKKKAELLNNKIDNYVEKHDSSPDTIKK